MNSNLTITYKSPFLEKFKNNIRNSKSKHLTRSVETNLNVNDSTNFCQNNINKINDEKVKIKKYLQYFVRWAIEKNSFKGIPDNITFLNSTLLKKASDCLMKTDNYMSNNSSRNYTSRNFRPWNNNIKHTKLQKVNNEINDIIYDSNENTSSINSCKNDNTKIISTLQSYEYENFQNTDDSMFSTVYPSTNYNKIGSHNNIPNKIPRRQLINKVELDNLLTESLNNQKKKTSQHFSKQLRFNKKIQIRTVESAFNHKVHKAN